MKFEACSRCTRTCFRNKTRSQGESRDRLQIDVIPRREATRYPGVENRSTHGSLASLGMKGVARRR
jgi:hypothetical protein